VRVLLAEVFDFDLDARELHLRPVSPVPAPERLGYDTLIVSGGSNYSYFGHEEWQMYAAEVKSLESTLAVRSLKGFKIRIRLTPRLGDTRGGVRRVGRGGRSSRP
jgi:NADH dehydrogenase FAD-containing subunit